MTGFFGRENLQAETDSEREQSALLQDIRDAVRTMQMGDSTASPSQAEIITTEQTTSLGAQGKFTDPELGLMIGRYIKFDSMVSTDDAAAIYQVASGQVWAGTNAPGETSQARLIGVSFGDNIESGNYGWVQIEGLNHREMLSDTDGIPKAGDLFTIGGAALGTVADEARFVIEGANIIAMPGAVMFEVESLQAQNRLRGEISSNRDELKSLLAAGIPDTSGFITSSDVSALIDKLSQKLGVDIRTIDRAVYNLSNEIRHLTDDEAYIAQQSILAAVANFHSLSRTDAENASADADRVSTLAYAVSEDAQSARVWQDEAGIHAESARMASNTALLSRNDSAEFAFAGAESAAEAKVSETEAGLSAEASETARLAAAILLSEVQSAAEAVDETVVTATEQAAEATRQADLSADFAQDASDFADDAAGFAGDSLASAGVATTQAGYADGYRASALSSSNLAASYSNDAKITSVTGPILQSDFTEDGKYWVVAAQGFAAPPYTAVTPDPALGGSLTYITTSGRRALRIQNPPVYVDISPQGWLPLEDKTYEITINSSTNTPTGLRIYFAYLTTAGQLITHNNQIPAGQTGSWGDFTFRSTPAMHATARGLGAVRVRPFVRVAEETGVSLISRIEIKDVTAVANAEASATAASASAISASADAATATTQADLSVQFSKNNADSNANEVPVALDPWMYAGNVTGGPVASVGFWPNEYPAGVGPDNSYLDVIATAIGARGVFAIGGGEVWRTTFITELMAAADGIGSWTGFYLRYLDADYNFLANSGVNGRVDAAVGEEITNTYHFVGSADSAKAAGLVNVGVLPAISAGMPVKYFRIMLLVNRPFSGGTQAGTTRVKEFSNLRIDGQINADIAKTQASIAETQATAANISAGTASTQANLAAGYRTDALGYRNEALGYRNTANSAANAASGSAVTAAAGAASAESFANLAASIGQGSLNTNPVFADWPDSATAPTDWAPASNRTRVEGRLSPYALEMVGGAGQNSVHVSNYVGSAPDSIRGVSPGDWLVVEGDMELMSGTFSGAGVYIGIYSAASTQVQTITGPILGATGTIGAIHPVRNLVQVTHPDSYYIRLLAAAHVSTLGSIAVANRVRFHRAAVRYASQAEIDTQTVLAPLEASVSVNQGAIANLAGASAFYEVEVAASGSTPAKVSLKAGSGGSKVDLVAESLTIRNPVNGQLVEVARFESGSAELNNALIRNLLVFPLNASTISHRVMLEPLEFLGKDGDIITYQSGATYGTGNLPSAIERDISGLPSLAADEQYDVKATAITPTQFQVHAKKLSAPVNVTTEDTGGTNVGGTPKWQLHKTKADNASDNKYMFSYTVTLAFSHYMPGSPPRPPPEYDPGTPDAYVYIGIVDLYVRNASASNAWVKVQSKTLYRTYTTNQGSSKSTTESTVINTAINIGQSANREFGIHEGAGATITAFGKVSYQTLTSGATVPLTNLIPFKVYPPKE